MGYNSRHEYSTGVSKNCGNVTRSQQMEIYKYKLLLMQLK